MSIILRLPCEMTGMAMERDFRKLALARQAALRGVAVALARAGKTRIEAAEGAGVNRRFVARWVKAVDQSGEAVLAGGRRGRRPGEQQALSAAQEDRLGVLIARGCPDQVGLCFALWTRQGDAPGGAGADCAREWGLAGSAGGRPLSAGLGRHRAAADAPGHRCAGPPSGGMK